MTSTKRISIVAIVILLSSGNAYAAAVQTFSGLLPIGDSVNTPGVLIGTNFSIDGDGTFDLNLAYGGTNINSIFGWNANARESSPGSAQIFVTSGNFARMFALGESIGPGGTAVADALLGAADDFGGADGNFVPDDPLFGKKRGFIGFSFLIGGNTHYGWADVEVDVEGDFGEGFLNLYGYGYETDADTANLAGAGIVPLPAAIWLFGSALAGLGWLRRKQTV